jgi:hypothetical protein
MEREKNGRRWLIGDQLDVAWIGDNTVIGMTIDSAIPPAFEAYATVLVPGFGPGRSELDLAVLAVLEQHASDQPWWLGYLDTGTDDIVFHDVPQVQLYAGWKYVVAQAGPAEAASWRAAGGWRGALPDLMFPADRCWLISRLWDDDWWCLGGSDAVVGEVVADHRFNARAVRLGEDATPPGHQAR